MWFSLRVPFLSDISLRGAFGVLDRLSPRNRRGAFVVIVSKEGHWDQGGIENKEF